MNDRQVISYNLADMSERVAAQVGDRVAVTYAGRNTTWAEFDERANRLATVLQENGTAEGSTVGLFLHNHPAFLETMLAAYKLRAVPFNINFRYGGHELAGLFVDARPSVVVCDQELVIATRDGLKLAGHDATVLSVASELCHPFDTDADDFDSVVNAAKSSLGRDRRSCDDGYLCFTGGTTGRPKGVIWRHEDIFFAALNSIVGLQPESTWSDYQLRVDQLPVRTMVAAPLMHVLGHWLAWATLLSGGSVILDPHWSFDPRSIWELSAAERANLLVIAGEAMGRPLADSLPADRYSRLDNLILVVSGGARLSSSTSQRLCSALPQLAIHDGLGASEAGAIGRGNKAATDPSLNAFEAEAGVTVLGDDLRPVEPGSGQAGRLARTGHIPQGYLNDDEATARQFPVIDGVRWAVLNDEATILADGRISLLGRLDLSINTAGEKVHAEEVETTLVSHPEVADAVVIGMPDELAGQRVIALIQPTPESALDSNRLRTWARQRMAGYKVPKNILFVDQIQRLANGKQDYNWARAVAENLW